MTPTRYCNNRLIYLPTAKYNNYNIQIIIIQLKSQWKRLFCKHLESFQFNATINQKTLNTEYKNSNKNWSELNFITNPVEVNKPQSLYLLGLWLEIIYWQYFFSSTQSIHGSIANKPFIVSWTSTNDTLPPMIIDIVDYFRATPIAVPTTFHTTKSIQYKISSTIHFSIDLSQYLFFSSSI